MPAPVGVQPGELDPEPSSSVQTPADQPASSPAAGSRSGRGRRWLRVLKVIGLVIALPILALLIGLLIAWIVHLIRGNPPVHTGQTPATQPSASSTAPTTSPTTAPQAVTVPADWVTEDQPPQGITYRHPAGWVRRTSGTAVLRFAPVAPGSLTPGIEGVGAQLAPAGTTPEAAIRAFVSSNYGGQPGYAAAAPAAVKASTPGAHPGELRSVVTYTRSGVPVRVVVDAYSVTTPSGARTVLVLGRSAASTPARAATLESFIEASLKVS
jgi:hypothetical protein